MTSSPHTGSIFGAVFARGGAAREVTDRAWLHAMVEFEAALAGVQARAGIIPDDAAQAIAGACQRPLDAAAATAGSSATGTPVAGVVAQLREYTGAPHAQYVHYGATSQDVMDSAAMLVTKRALVPIRADLADVADTCATLAEEHRDTVMAGRTLLQQAVTITFGLKAARWMSGVDTAIDRLDSLHHSALAVQYGGAAGTLCTLDDRGPEVTRALAERLRLATPELAWHSDRTRIADIAGALGIASGSCAKIATDIRLLAQTEVAEASEAPPAGDDSRAGTGGITRGGSTAMPHKRNPVAAVAAGACAQRTPALVATLLGSMAGEHERAAGAWHTEWETLSDLLRLTSSAASWLLESLRSLTVFPDRMLTNLAAPLRGGSLGSAGADVDRALRRHRGHG
ncbi:3-carboxy-cis,cis-muconate cycloisomerase [Phytoactinopolyspora mesophila]|uniref:3-carboxy-cis,cis-muconate cycloisomerase n=1 Tax=Phytoactinopolyspora mesophila TaxID=2650750 RepID=A0A7K3M113_9ACTN|nr:3-carboxy-cis,cis-muconate cycloisomerase [Phytoactinopolyspora mesophila]